MELARTDYTNETELARLREEMEALRTINAENALMLDDIRLPLLNF